MNSCLAADKAAMSHALAYSILARVDGGGVSRESEPGLAARLYVYMRYVHVYLICLL